MCISESGGNCRFGNRFADAGYAVGEPTAGRVGDALAKSAPFRGVQGIDEDWHGGEEPNPAGKPRCMREVGMGCFRLVLMKPRQIPQPASRIDPGLGHAEGQVADAGKGEVRCGWPSCAGERDDGDSPAACGEAFGQQEELAFGATDLVDGGDKHCDAFHGPASGTQRGC